MPGKTRLSRRSLLAGASALALPAGLATPAAAQGKLVRYGISMADIPLTSGQPDRGAGAYQFTGYTIYDPLVAWEMDVADRPGKLIPGLATDWKVDEADKTLWSFKLRPGVTFHDGSAFNADAVVWNLEKVFNKDAPQFDQRQASQVRPRLPSIASYKKLDDMKTTLAAGTVSKHITGSLLQLDTWGTHGLSGAPVFDLRGNVVGVVWGGPADSQARVVYAVPSDKLVQFLGEAGKEIVR